MTWKPAYVLIDFETSENGKGSTEFYRAIFQVDSMAASWCGEDGAVRSLYFEGENGIRTFLERLSREGIPVVAHNTQFEMGVMACRFPQIQLLWSIDTMRLVQVYDNGGDKFAVELPPSYDDELGAFLDAEGEDGEEPKKKKKSAKPKSIAGLGLVKACKRILNLPNHKEEAHAWIRENIPESRKGTEGRFLSKLPIDIARRYNVGDTEAALKLCKFLLDYFKSINYDWTFDHRLYFNSVKLLVEAKIRGVLVERSRLGGYRNVVEAEIEGMGVAFRRAFEKEIALCERDRLRKRLAKLRTLRGQKRYLGRYRSGRGKELEEIGFNVGSNQQLQALFVDRMRIEPKFLTKKGAPAFRSSCLGQWGDGGLMLAKRRKRLLVLKQCEALLALSEHTGRWHIDLRACGTATGRYSGGIHV